MKQIFPTSSKQIEKVSQDKCCYDSLVERVNEAVDTANSTQDSLEQYKNANQQNFGTNHLTSNTALLGDTTVSKLTADSAEISGDVSLNNLTSNNICNDCCIRTKELFADDWIYAHCLRSANAWTQNIDVTNKLNACSADICNICSYNDITKQLQVRCGTATFYATPVEVLGCDVCIHGWTGETATLTTDNLCVKCNWNTENLSANTVETTSLATTNTDTNYITHTADPQEVTEVADTGDYYILFPQFTNGFYLIEAKNDTDKRLWAVELLNSQDNIEFRWSEQEIGYIQDIKYTTDASGVAIVQIHANSLNEHATLYRQSITTDNTLPPTIYVDDQIPDVSLEDEKSGIVIQQKAGTYINNVIFTDKLHIKCLEMDALFMDCVGVYRKLFLTDDFNQSGDILEPVPTSGCDKDYIQNQIICGQITPHWTKPAETITTDCDNLTPSCVVAKYDGEYQAVCGYHQGFERTEPVWNEVGTVYEYDETSTPDYSNWEKDQYNDIWFAPDDYEAYFKYDEYWPYVRIKEVVTTDEGKHLYEGTTDSGLVVFANSTIEDGEVVYSKSEHIKYEPESTVYAAENLSQRVGYRIDDKIYRPDGSYIEYYDRVNYYKITDIPDYDAHHPIVHLGDNSCVHGSIEVECNAVVNNNLTVCCNFKSPHIGDTTAIECGLQIVQDQTTCTYVTYDESRIVDVHWPADIFGNYVCQIGEDGHEWCRYYDIAPEFNDWCVRYYLDGCDCGLRLLGDTPMRYFVERYMPGYPGVPYDYWFAPMIVEQGQYNNTTANVCRPGFGYDIAPYMECTCIVDSDLHLMRRECRRCDELAAYNCECEWDEEDDNHKLLRWNGTSNTVEPTLTAKLEDLEVDNLTVNCDAVVKGDLYVEGVTHTVEEETVSTSSDMIVLRQNNPTTLAQGEASGIIINNATEDGSIAVITDSTGTLRIGEPKGTDSTFTDIYYKNGHWYSDLEETTEVTPSGELTSWDSKEITENGSTHYTNAIFTEFDYSKLSPVLGRDEIANMTNNALLVFNCSTWEANTLTIPTTNGASLKYNTNTCSYYWEKSAGVYHFASIACYEEAANEIPVDSIVIIDDEDNYTVREDK